MVAPSNDHRDRLLGWLPVQLGKIYLMITQLLRMFVDRFKITKYYPARLQYLLIVYDQETRSHSRGRPRSRASAGVQVVSRAT